MSVEQDEHDVELLRERLFDATRHIEASPGLPERAAGAARARRRRRRLAVAGVAVPAVIAAAAVALVRPFGTTPAQAAATSVTSCPATPPGAANPGVSGPDMMPSRPGAILVCGYADEYLPGQQSSYKPVGSRVIEGAEARAEAAAINGGTVIPHPRRCPYSAHLEVLFFRNSAGHEAVIVKTMCGGASDGRRNVDPSQMTWFLRP